MLTCCIFICIPPHTTTPPRLTRARSDIFRTLKGPWESAHEYNVVMAGWRATGWSPFDMRVYWEVKKDEDYRATLLKKTTDLDPTLARSITASTLLGVFQGSTAEGAAAEAAAAGEEPDDNDDSNANDDPDARRRAAIATITD